MSGRRKSKPVTLAGRAALKQVPTHTLSENGPTPERLMQAGVTVAMQLGTRQTQIIGKASPFGIEGVIRLSEAPLDRLHSRGRLDDCDADRNRHLFEAGDKLRTHHYRAGMIGLSACNLNSVHAGGGDPAWAMPASEAVAFHRYQYRKAQATLDPGDWTACEAIICQEASLEDAGRLCGFANLNGANAVALDRLRRGLANLCLLWGIGPPRRPVATAA